MRTLPAPGLVVIWRISEACALGCRFCATAARLGACDGVPTRRRSLAFGKVLAAEQRESSRSILVSWLGGEPLQWPAIRSLVPAFDQDLGLRQGLATAGPPLASARVRAMVIAPCRAAHDQHRRPRPVPRPGSRLSGALRAAPRLVAHVAVRGPGRGGLSAREHGPDAWQHRRLRPALRGDGRLGVPRADLQPPRRSRSAGVLPREPAPARQVRRFADELPGLRRRMAERGLCIRGGEAYLGRMEATAQGERLAVEDVLPGDEGALRGRTGPGQPVQLHERRLRDPDRRDRFAAGAAGRPRPLRRPCGGPSGSRRAPIARPRTSLINSRHPKSFPSVSGPSLSRPEEGHERKPSIGHVSEAPTNPQREASQPRFDVADLYRGPVADRSGRRRRPAAGRTAPPGLLLDRQQCDHQPALRHRVRGWAAAVVSVRRAVQHRHASPPASATPASCCCRCSTSPCAGGVCSSAARGGARPPARS